MSELCSNRVWTMFEHCLKCVRTMFELCSNRVRTMLEPYPNSVRTLFELWSNHVRTVFEPCSNCVRTICELCSNRVHVSQQTTRHGIAYMFFETHIEKHHQRAVSWPNHFRATNINGTNGHATHPNLKWNNSTKKFQAWSRPLSDCCRHQLRLLH